MINRVIEFSLRNRFLIVGLTSAGGRGLLGDDAHPGRCHTRSE